MFNHNIMLIKSKKLISLNLNDFVLKHYDIQK